MHFFNIAGEMLQPQVQKNQDLWEYFILVDIE
jgi:hypothetical protein